MEPRVKRGDIATHSGPFHGPVAGALITSEMLIPASPPVFRVARTSTLARRGYRVAFNVIIVKCFFRFTTRYTRSLDQKQATRHSSFRYSNQICNEKKRGKSILESMINSPGIKRITKYENTQVKRREKKSNQINTLADLPPTLTNASIASERRLAPLEGIKIMDVLRAAWRAHLSPFSLKPFKQS